MWVKKHKPKTSEEAGSLPEDLRQARKKELWQKYKTVQLFRKTWSQNETQNGENQNGSTSLIV